jgi:hypothetical protein
MTPVSRVPAALAAFAAIVLSACASSPEPAMPEDNVGFFFSDNLACVMAEVNGKAATMAIATALPRTAIGYHLKEDRAGARVLLGSTLVTSVRPTALELGALPVDGLLGADAFRGRIVTIDYFRGLLILSAWPRVRPDLTPWDFAGGPPRVPVTINGRSTVAVVDTALPDTALVPSDMLASGTGDRATVSMVIAGVRFDELDVAVAPVTMARLGSRTLSRFMVSIDYAREKIGLWPDPRTSDASRR